MRYIKPHYYDDFKCIADKCPDTCCAGWQIVIDGQTLDKYEKDFSLATEIDWQEGIFKQYGGRCAMLDEHNLCKLIKEKGEDWLCDTCNRYPRHIEEFDGIREYSLSLSCPVAAEMMLRMEEPVRFLTEEDEEDDPLEEEFEDFDFLLFTQLQDARNVLFTITQDRELSVEKRMQLLMQMARKMQECLDEERLYEMEDIIEEYGRYREVRCEEAYDRYGVVKANFKVFHELEHLRAEWSDVLADAEKILYAGNAAEYQAVCGAFYQEYIVAYGEKKWNVFLEQILMFFLYTYFCGAVYDDCIYSKVGMVVFSATYIQEFIMCSWYKAGKHIDMQECIRIAYRYAREVEHSDENLNALEEWLLERM